MNSRSALRFFAVAALVLVSLVLVACGGSDGTTGGSTGGSTGGTAETADVAAAKQFIAPFVGQPSPFPVVEKLDELPKPGSTVAFLDLGTPVTALMWQLMQPAAKTLGLDLFRVQANGPGGISTAMDSIVERHPDGVIFFAADPTAFSHQLEELREDGATVVAGSIVNGEEFGFETVQFGRSGAEEVGELMAAWTVANTNGEAHNVVFYNVPELPFSNVVREGVESKMGEICSECNVRVVDIPLAEVGKNSSDRVISDLQANPDTDYALFPNDEMQLGLPAAMETAGIDVPTFGGGPTPGNLEAVQKGEEEAVLGIDVGTLVWTIVDQFARELGGQKVTGLEAEGKIVMQFLTAKDLKGTNPALGWSGYPDFPVRFAKLWGVQPQ